VLLLDTHVVYWWVVDSPLLSLRANQAIDASLDELAVTAITWFELSWLIQNNRIAIDIPLPTWLRWVSGLVQTIPITPSIAMTAAQLPTSFPGDPMDRLIYATAIEEGIQLVTRDEAMRRYPAPRQITIW
jgi:PIN domain nuclease of toxin-antitoxin system